MRTKKPPCLVWVPVTQEQKIVIRQAAAIKDLPMSQFVAQVATQAATVIVRGQK